MDKIQAFADRLHADYKARLEMEYPGLDAEFESRVTATMGKRWVRVDVGTSGKYMVDLDGTIYGIKAYGVPHPKHKYGTLDTIEEWDWSGYHAVKKQGKASASFRQNHHDPDSEDCTD